MNISVSYPFYGAARVTQLPASHGTNSWDFALTNGDPVAAIDDGIVRSVFRTQTQHVLPGDERQPYGNLVTIEHTSDSGQTYFATYLHLEPAGQYTDQYGKVYVGTGIPDHITKDAVVRKGDLLGYVGSSGISYSSQQTPAHLHLELSLNTKPAYFNDGQSTTTGVVADGKNPGAVSFVFPDVLSAQKLVESDLTENTLPVANDDFLTADGAVVPLREDGTLRISVAKLLANDRDADGDPLRLVDYDGDGSGSANNPWVGNGRAVLENGSVFVFTPDPGATVGRFAYAINDGRSDDSDWANVEFNIPQQSTAPTPPPETGFNVKLSSDYLESGLLAGGDTVFVTRGTETLSNGRTREGYFFVRQSPNGEAGTTFLGELSGPEPSLVSTGNNSVAEFADGSVLLEMGLPGTGGDYVAVSPAGLVSQINLPEGNFYVNLTEGFSPEVMWAFDYGDEILPTAVAFRSDGSTTVTDVHARYGHLDATLTSSGPNGLYLRFNQSSAQSDSYYRMREDGSLDRVSFALLNRDDFEWTSAYPATYFGQLYAAETGFAPLDSGRPNAVAVAKLDSNGDVVPGTEILYSVAFSSLPEINSRGFGGPSFYESGGPELRGDHPDFVVFQSSESITYPSGEQFSVRNDLVVVAVDDDFNEVSRATFQLQSVTYPQDMTLQLLDDGRIAMVAMNEITNANGDPEKTQILSAIARDGQTIAVSKRDLPDGTKSVTNLLMAENGTFVAVIAAADDSSDLLFGVPGRATNLLNFNGYETGVFAPIALPGGNTAVLVYENHSSTNFEQTLSIMSVDTSGIARSIYRPDQSSVDYDFYGSSKTDSGATFVFRSRKPNDGFTESVEVVTVGAEGAANVKKLALEGNVQGAYARPNGDMSLIVWDYGASLGDLDLFHWLIKPDGRVQQTALDRGTEQNRTFAFEDREGNLILQVFEHGSAHDSVEELVTYTITPTGGVSKSSTLFVPGGSNTPPEFTYAGEPNVFEFEVGEDLPFSIANDFYDEDGDPLTFSYSGLPAGMQGDRDEGYTFGKITAKSGNYSVSITATDPAGETAVGQYTFVVRETEDKPDLGKLALRTSTPWESETTGGQKVYKLINPASVDLGHKDGDSRLIRIEGASEISVEQGNLKVKGGTIVELMSGRSNTIMKGDFTLDLTTLETSKLSETAVLAKSFSPALVDDFGPTSLYFQKDAVVFRGGLVFGNNQKLTIGADLLNVTFDRNGPSMSLAEVNTGQWFSNTPLEFSLPGTGGKVKAVFSDMSVGYSSVYDSIFLGGKAQITIAEDHILTVDLAGKQDTATRFFDKGDKYIRLGDADRDGQFDWDIVATASYEYKTDYGATKSLLKKFNLEEIKVDIDTWNNSFSAEATAYLGFLGGFTGTAGFGLNWDPFSFESLTLGFTEANIPTPAPGLFISDGTLTAIDLNNDSEDGRAYGITFGGFFGKPTVKGTPNISPLKFEGSGKIGAGGFSGELEISTKTGDAIKVSEERKQEIVDKVEKYFDIDFNTFLDTELLNVKTEFDLKPGDSVSVKAEVKALFETIQADLNFKVSDYDKKDSDADFLKYKLDGSGKFFAPKGLAVIGGRELASANFEIQYIDDGLGKNDYIKAWVDAKIFNYEASYGVKFDFGGDITWLGKDGIELIGSWQLYDTMDWAMMTATWENASDTAELVVITPDGARISEAEFALHDDIELVTDLNSPYNRSVAVANPETGIWDIEIVDPTGLGEITYEASQGIEMPSIGDWTISTGPDGVITAMVKATSPEVEATLQLFADTDGADADGVAVAGPAQEIAGDALTFTWDPQTFAPGTYHLYAQANGDDVIPVTDYASQTVTVTGYTDLQAIFIEGMNTELDQHSYTVRITNGGTIAATDVTLTMTLPADGVTELARATGPLMFENGVASVDIGSLGAGEVVDFTFVVDIDHTHVNGFLSAEVLGRKYDANLTNNLAEFNLGISADREVGGPTDFTDVADHAKGFTGRTLNTLDGDDSVIHGVGAKTGTLGAGDDQLQSFAGRGDIAGGTGHDYLSGGMQSDSLQGGDGNDALRGDSSAMLGAGDVLNGGKGNDLLMGRHGADTFEFAPNDGNDTIASFAPANLTFDAVDGYSATGLGQDFNPALDRIMLDGFGTVTASNVMQFVSTQGASAIFDAEGTQITFVGLTADALSSENFIFS